MYIHRSAERHVWELAKHFPAVVCTGARQVGKTTLLTALFPDHQYVSLDLPSRAALAEETPDTFLSTYAPPLLIDEVQYAPGLFRYLKIAIDANRHSMGQYILTGSQKFQLMQGLSESLAGRVGIAELETLSFAESAAVYGNSVERWICRGGYPELARDPGLARDYFMDAYLATYLERDVRQILQVGNLRDFERFVRFLATRSAQQLSLSASARAIGVDTKTAGAWLSVLEASGQITLLEPWFGNLGKRIVKTPKLYFNDTGLLCYLLGTTAEDWHRSPFFGAIWETAVFGEIRAAIATRGSGRPSYYYRDQQGTEVDFIIPGNPTVVLEAKTSEHPTQSDTRGIAKLRTLADNAGALELQNFKGAIVCRTPEAFPIKGSEGIDAVGLADLGNFVNPASVGNSR
jgi:uncharacterized protein